jgi:Domain of unknown function (DUF4440)
MKALIATCVAFTGLSLCAASSLVAQSASPASSSESSTAGSTETKIKAMEETWAASQMQKDHGASVVEGMLASDYAGVGSKGEIRDKTSQIEHIRNDTDTYTSSKNDTMKVRTYGSDAATVCGTSTESGKDKDGKKFNRSFAWVDTWMQRNGQWQCIASGGTPLTKK